MFVPPPSPTSVTNGDNTGPNAPIGGEPDLAGQAVAARDRATIPASHHSAPTTPTEEEYELIIPLSPHGGSPGYNLHPLSDSCEVVS